MKLSFISNDVALRNANRINPIFDEALRELDEYNKRAQAEEMKE